MLPLEQSFIDGALNSSSQNSCHYFISADEVGRGALFGPVTVGGVLIESERFGEILSKDWAGRVDDSKNLSQKVREELDLIIRKEVRAHVSHVSVGFIEKYNINRAIQYGLYRLVNRFQREIVQSGEPGQIDFILLDGNYRFEFPQLRMPAFLPDIHPIVKGDSRSFSIGCASIVAKVARDRLIGRASERFPELDLDQNAGYGTKKHREALLNGAKTPFHRNVFLRKILSENIKTADKYR